jgi:acetolactate synthase-1/2/3 large subunit
MTDVGNSQKWIVQQFEITEPGTRVTSLGGAAMGFGPCGVLGAQLAMPGRKVACVTGDGSMSMSLHVLPTAVEYDIPVVYVVANDYAYASVMRPQQMRFGEDRVGHFTVFENRAGDPYRLDFAAVAEAVGMKAERVTKAGDLAGALERALDAGGPYLLDVEVERDTYVPLTGGGTFVLPARE